jgi:hypothetical protein
VGWGHQAIEQIVDIDGQGYAICVIRLPQDSGNCRILTGFVNRGGMGWDGKPFTGEHKMKKITPYFNDICKYFDNSVGYEPEDIFH